MTTRRSTSKLPNYRARTYLTGVRYSPKAEWLLDWIPGGIPAMPVTSYYATPEATAQAAAQLESLGYHVQLVTR